MMTTASRRLFHSLLAIMLLAGCARQPVFLPEDWRKPIDRKLVEYPNGFVLKTIARGLTAPSAIAFVNDEGEFKGSILVAESGVGSELPRIYGWTPEGTYFSIFPRGTRLPSFGILPQWSEFRGPIGGMAVSQGRIFVTHRDSKGRGVVSSIGFDGSITTLMANMPAEGDYSLTDIIVHPTSGRLFFGIGSATNSGVVGLDDWQIGWVDKHPQFCDLPANNLKLLGNKFFTRNPRAGLFGGDDNVGTGPFQPFASSTQLRIRKAPDEKPTSAIYSIAPTGGDLRLIASGIRLPRGLAFDEYANLFATNDGMELRGTRPVKDDPDSLLKIIPNTWYGFPDFSADLQPISDARFQPPAEIIIRSGYPELSFLIDHASSGLSSPASYRDTLLFGTFLPLSGAAKMDFAPANGNFHDYRGSAIVALSGDRAPFATDGQKLRAQPSGYKIVRVDLDGRRVEEFIHNTELVPESKLHHSGEALERPVDVKFGPDGKLYILDYGRMEVRNGREKLVPGSGRIFLLEPAEPVSTTPAPRSSYHSE
jgi:glucose/arabinose dehydrogenase